MYNCSTEIFMIEQSLQYRFRIFIKDFFSFRSFLTTLVILSSIVISVFVILWLPWLNSTENALQVVHRIFPIGRGVFEDKVANFWCSFNVIYKLK